MKEYKFKIGGKEYNVTVNPKEGYERVQVQDRRQGV